MRTAYSTGASSFTKTRKRLTPNRPIETCCCRDNAQIDTKPQLEIYADDVKCTHGATIGQIDEGALFYLRSRGIEESSARKLLLSAFASECLDRMKPGAARSHVEKLIDESLSSFLQSADNGPGDAKLDERELSWEEVG